MDMLKELSFPLSLVAWPTCVLSLDIITADLRAQALEGRIGVTV